MAYTINRTDGSVVASITDGTIDNSTSLTLFGKSYSGFGEALNENLVKLLENQASTSQPSAPQTGELWFDTTSKSIKVYDGTSFKPTGGAKAEEQFHLLHLLEIFGWIQQTIRYLYTQVTQEDIKQTVDGNLLDQFTQQVSCYQVGKLKHLAVLEETKLYPRCTQVTRE